MLFRSRSEEESFGRTIDRGLHIFTKAAAGGNISGATAFELYDTYGFPLDMTQLLATERGLTVDANGFETEMEKQRERGRAAQKKEVIVAATEGEAERHRHNDGPDEGEKNASAVAEQQADVLDGKRNDGRHD